jgi:hypothetical protein
MKTKFNETFALYNSQTVRVLRDQRPGESPWAQHDNVIATSAYASWSEERRAEIAQVGWDLVVIDEAHHARRRLRGKNISSNTNLYRLASELVRPELGEATSLLLLTATPMQLDRSELYSLVDLLDPTLFPDHLEFIDHCNALGGLNRVCERLQRWSNLDEEAQLEVVETAARWLERTPEDVRASAKDANTRAVLGEELAERHRLSAVMVRNRKSRVGGFRPRRATVWQVELTGPEREAYDAVTEYVRTGYQRSLESQSAVLGFLMTTFQKLNASSSQALKRSLERRIERLLGESNSRPQVKVDEETEAALEELPTAEVVEVLPTDPSVPETEDVAELRRLVGLLERIPIDSKARVLASGLEEVRRDETEAGRPPKVLVFTQFRDTQDYIAEHAPPGWAVEIFHGQLRPEQKDAAVQRFRDANGPCLLISTEAGGEGRNFQFCHWMVNYDLPWNPMRVEQRIGRIDRIGQKHDPRIINFAVLGTIEERILEVLTNRIRLFEETVGGLDPILGNLEREFAKNLIGTKSPQDLQTFERDLEERVREARRAEQQLGDLIMDTRSFRQDEVERLLRSAEDGVLDHRALKVFTIQALELTGVSVRDDESVPGAHSLLLRNQFASLFPSIVRDGERRRVTFDPEVARENEWIEFLAFGHPIVDGLVDYVRGRSFSARATHRVVVDDERAGLRGWWFVFVLEIDGIISTKELFPVLIRDDGVSDPDGAGWLLNRAAQVLHEDRGHGRVPDRGNDFQNVVDMAQAAALRRLMQRQSEMDHANAERIAHSRDRLARLFDHRERGAQAKLETAKRVLQELAAAGTQAVVPLWTKNVQNAMAVVDSLARERTQRLAELESKQQVSGQHSLLAASYVEVHPDPRMSLRSLREELTDPLFQSLRRRMRWCAERELNDWRTQVQVRRAKLRDLATRASFDSQTADTVAEALESWLGRPDRLGEVDRFLLAGAVDYFLDVDDESNDLKSSNGFRDDAQVLQAVVREIKRRRSA